jgi:hypothetical protein
MGAIEANVQSARSLSGAWLGRTAGAAMAARDPGTAARDL